jgi:hypothetical protein
VTGQWFQPYGLRWHYTGALIAEGDGLVWSVCNLVTFSSGDNTLLCRDPGGDRVCQHCRAWIAEHEPPTSPEGTNG